MPWKEMTLLQGKSTISSAVNKLLRSLFSCLESAAPPPIQETGLNLSCEPRECVRMSYG